MLTKKERELISGVCHGNARAFFDLVENYKDMVFTLALRMLGNREDAEEVSQDIFMKVNASLGSFKGDSKLSTWIYRIAHNACLDKIKGNRREGRFIQQGEPTRDIADLDSALERMAQAERTAMIQACLAKLSPGDASILTLYYYGETNLVELGKVTGLSESTLKVRLFRARKRLAGIMEGILDQETLRNYG